jgi:lysozyme
MIKHLKKLEAYLSINNPKKASKLSGIIKMAMVNQPNAEPEGWAVKWDHPDGTTSYFGLDEEGDIYAISSPYSEDRRFLGNEIGELADTVHFLITGGENQGVTWKQEHFLETARNKAYADYMDLAGFSSGSSEDESYEDAGGSVDVGGPSSGVTSARGREFLISKEGVRTEAYRDSPRFSIAVGNTYYPPGFRGNPNKVYVRDGDRITPAEAMEIFNKVIKEYEANVRNNVRVPIQQHQFDALVSLSYNLGPGAMRDIYAVINNKEGDAAIREIILSKNKNLPDILDGRRRQEADLYLKGIYP